jgi:hypothetical protein
MALYSGESALCLEPHSDRRKIEPLQQLNVEFKTQKSVQTIASAADVSVARDALKLLKKKGRQPDPLRRLPVTE